MVLESRPMHVCRAGTARRTDTPRRIRVEAFSAPVLSTNGTLDLKKTVTMDNLGGYPACLRAIRDSDRRGKCKPNVPRPLVNSIWSKRQDQACPSAYLNSPLS